MSSNNPRIPRVPALLIAEEEDEMKKNDYYPKVASIGPYHYGKPELAQVEAFKPFAVDLLVRGREEKDFFYQKVLDMIGQVRNCYEKESVDKYSDADLAQMMLRDASLIIAEMEIYVLDLLEPRKAYHKSKAMIDHLGRLTGAVLFRDFILVENQIPLCVIQLLVELRHGADKGREMINNYVNQCILGESRPIVKSSRVPLHLLEFMHIILVYDCFKTKESSRGSYSTGDIDMELMDEESSRGSFSTGDIEEGGSGKSGGDPEYPTEIVKGIYLHLHSFSKVMELKARGIHFRPSATQSLLDVRFKSGFFYGTLQLPEMTVSQYSKPFFKNLVAYELLPGVETEPTVTSYINFMQSLVESLGDLEELLQRKIVFNQLGSNEEALNVFKDINTHGASDVGFYFKVRRMIQLHYDRRINTWIAELIHTHFRSPWTFIAFLAAAAIIALTAAQLYYDVHPVADKTPTSS